jgi:hypothetical protein
MATTNITHKGSRETLLNKFSICYIDHGLSPNYPCRMSTITSMAYLNISPFLGGYLNITEKVWNLVPHTQDERRKVRTWEMVVLTLDICPRVLWPDFQHMLCTLWQILGLQQPDPNPISTLPSHQLSQVQCIPLNLSQTTSYVPRPTPMSVQHSPWSVGHT